MKEINLEILILEKVMDKNEFISNVCIFVKKKENQYWLWGGSNSRPLDLKSTA